jgi:hypothetical protein
MNPHASLKSEKVNVFFIASLPSTIAQPLESRGEREPLRSSSLSLIRFGDEACNEWKKKTIDIGDTFSLQKLVILPKNTHRKRLENDTNDIIKHYVRAGGGSIYKFKDYYHSSCKGEQRAVGE